MKVIIDRFEGNFALCEDENRKEVRLEKSRLPKGACEGSILHIGPDGIQLNTAETDVRKMRAQELLARIFQNGKR